MNSDHTPTAKPRSRRSKALLVLQVLGTCVFTLIIILSVDWTETFRILRLTRLWYLSVLPLLYLLSVGLAAARCKMLFVGLGQGDLPFRHAFNHYLLSGVLSQVMPSTVGGDAVRAVALGRRSQGLTSGTSIVVLERLLGVSALLIWVLLPFALRVPMFRDSVILTRLGWTLVGLCAVGALVAAFYGMFLRHKKWAIARRFPWLTRVAEVPASAYRAGLLLLAQPLLLLATLLPSLMRTAVNSFSVWCILLALGTHSDVGAVLVIGAAVQAIAMIPLSIAGLGLREGALVVLLGELGIKSGTAMAAGILGRLALVLCLIMSLPFAWLAVRDMRSTATNETENRGEERPER